MMSFVPASRRPGYAPLLKKVRLVIKVGQEDSPFKAWPQRAY